MKRSAVVLLALAAMTLLATSSARASVIFTFGNNPQPNEENILLNTGATGAIVTGLTATSAITVQFSSTTDTLTEPTTGQARVTAQDDLVNNVSITVPGGSFEDVILNPFFSASSATVTAVANEPLGGQLTFIFSYGLGNGNNFLTITTAGGETLASVTIDAPSGFTDLRQPRISGASAAPRSVPEPSTLLVSGLGALMLGLKGLARRR